LPTNLREMLISKYKTGSIPTQFGGIIELADKEQPNLLSAIDYVEKAIANRGMPRQRLNLQKMLLGLRAGIRQMPRPRRGSKSRSSFQRRKSRGELPKKPTMGRKMR